MKRWLLSMGGLIATLALMLLPLAPAQAQYYGGNYYNPYAGYGYTLPYSTGYMPPMSASAYSGYYGGSYNYNYNNYNYNRNYGYMYMQPYSYSNSYSNSSYSPYFYPCPQYYYW